MRGRWTIARAIARRWRWPPETLLPPCAIGRVETVGHRLDEGARLRDLEGAPQLLVGGVGLAVTQVGGDRPAEEVRPLRDEADEPGEASSSISRTSTPSIVTEPPVTSNRRGTRLTSVVLPEPVLPITAVTSPGLATRSTPRSTGSSAPGYRNSTPSRRSRPSSPSTRDRRGWRHHRRSVSSTSSMRSAHASARGNMTNMKVAIITAINTWTR